ncbi:MAG: hypothetical protein GEV08_17055 [Acidimicrobiia bacterium]|nr:hypothetical protein [Acidimicrobiia bacterium]
MGEGPLAGVRVLDLSDELGRFAGKLLAESGADVVRLRPGEAGPAMADVPGGLLDWWYDGGTTAAPLDLDTAAGREAFVGLVAVADILLEGEPPGRLESLGLGPDALAERNPALVHVSLTPFGASGPRAAWQASDLVATAAGGILSVNGFPDEPVAIWGRQMGNAGGFYAAICALAGLARVRAGGPGLHADLSLQQVVASCSEHLLMFWWFPEVLAGLGAPVAARQGSLHWVKAYEVVECARGWCMVSPSAGGVPELIAWMQEHGLLTDLPADTPGDLALIPRLMEALHEFALGSDATELFEGGQARHVPFGEVLTVPQVAECPQHLHRGFFRPVAGAPPEVRLPGPLARFAGTPCPPPAPPPAAPVAASEVLERWGSAARPAAGGPGATGPGGPGRPGRPLEGLRVIDFTHVLAGPFATRALADLGADVVKVQTEVRAAGAHANDFPYFPMWNRSKRSLCLDMSRPGAADVLRRLVEQADVVIENFSAGVLDRWGAGWDQLSAWNSRLIYVAMQGAGTDGPWRNYVTFAPTVHALCGLTALTGPEGRLDCGTGVALNDHASGLAGAFAVLAAVEARRHSGVGQFIDLSQLEVGSYLVGPALLDWLANGREAVAAGTRDAFSDPVPNDVVRTGDDRWLAVTARDDAEWSSLAGVLGVAEPGLGTVQQRRARRPEVGRLLTAWAASQGAEEAAMALQEVGVPAYPVQDAAHLTSQDPQLAQRDWIVEMESPIWGSQQTDRFPAVLRDGSGPIELAYVHSPYLGEHTFEVAGELLGLEEAEVAERIGEGLFS